MPVQAIRQVAAFPETQDEVFQVSVSGEMDLQEVIAAVLERTKRKLGMRSGVYTLRSLRAEPMTVWQVRLEWQRDEDLAEIDEAVRREIARHRPH